MKTAKKGARSGTARRPRSTARRRTPARRSKATDAVFEEAMKLGSKDRSFLVYRLLDTLDDDPCDHMTDAEYDAEIDRRIDGFESGRIPGIPIDKVFADIRKKHKL